MQPQIPTQAFLWVFFYYFLPSSNLGHAKDIFKCFHLALPIPSCGLQHMIVCIRERELVGSAGRADKEACVPLASSPWPQCPTPRDLVASLCCIDQEFQMNCFLSSEQLQPLCWGPSLTSQNLVLSATWAKNAVVQLQLKLFQT